MPLRLHTFGEVSLRTMDGAPVAFPQKALLAIAYLFSNGCQPVSRLQLSRFLWEDVPPATAFVNFRKLTSRVKARQREIGAELLEIGARDVCVITQQVQPDFVVFLQRNETHERKADLSLQTKLLSLPFLPGVDVQSASFHAWRRRQGDVHTDALREHFLDALASGIGDQPANLIRSAGLLVLERRPDDEIVRQAVMSSAFPSDWVSQREQPAEVKRGHIIPFGPAATATLERAADLSQIPSGGCGPAPRLALLPPGHAQAGRSTQLASALIEDITIALCATRAISVVAPYTAEQISLGADKASSFERYSIHYVLETRVMAEERGRSFYAQLIFFGSDQVIWAQRFDIRDMGLLEARREISLSIADAISSEIRRCEGLRQSMERDPAAYRNYLLATRYAKQLDLPGVRRAKRLFRHAYQANPEFATALSGLARSHFLEWLLTARADNELLQRAEDLALQAVSQAPYDVFGHRELGVIRLYKRDFDGSLDALEHAERSSPQFADILASRADTLVQASRPDEGLLKIKQAIALNPLCPDEYFWTAAGASYSSGAYEQALSFISQMRQRAPADRLAAASHAMLGNNAQARRLVKKTLADNPAFSLEKWMTMVPFRESWQREHYREGLMRAGYR